MTAGAGPRAPASALVAGDFCRGACRRGWREWERRNQPDVLNPQYLAAYRESRRCLYCWEPLRAKRRPSPAVLHRLARGPLPPPFVPALPPAPRRPGPRAIRCTWCGARVHPWDPTDLRRLCDSCRLTRGRRPEWRADPDAAARAKALDEIREHLVMARRILTAPRTVETECGGLSRGQSAQALIDQADTLAVRYYGRLVRYSPMRGALMLGLDGREDV